MKQSQERPITVAVEDAPLPRELRHLAAELLAEGEVLALPTETVYGLAVRADDPRALERLRALKGIGAPRGFTWHVASREVLAGFPVLQPLLRRLGERYWPGPLTLVLEHVPHGLQLAADGGWTGLRMPAQRATLDLLQSLSFPVVASSANRHGAAPLTSAEDVRAEFGHETALILDGGPSRLAEASGVLRLGRGRFELLREGLLPIDDLRRTAGLRLAFACTGNTCRSPMAEGLARQVLRTRLGVPGGALDIDAFGFEVSSMGLSASRGSPAAQHAVEVMAELGVDLRQHESQAALPERVRALDRVYCMTYSHLLALRQSLPPGRDRQVELLDPHGEDVPDPIGGSRDDYRRCAEHLARAIEARAADWA
jgi:protein-tyrosine phosphatase